MGDSGMVEEDMASASKVESNMRDGTPSSIESTPEQDGVPEASQEQPAQPVKRKGGRKPVSIINPGLTWALTDSRADICYV